MPIGPFRPGFRIQVTNEARLIHLATASGDTGPRAPGDDTARDAGTGGEVAHATAANTQFDKHGGSVVNRSLALLATVGGADAVE